jgi:oligopeptide transport system substrate-binding protein
VVARAVTRLLPVALLGGVVWAVWPSSHEPADFTFVNATEVKSLDPAIVSGQPENRVINALFEGLVRWHPATLEPLPGVAERWEISPDGKVYTFHLRPTARWSDGRRLTADDFAWSFRRLIDPLTAGEYSYQFWYVRGARAYNTARVSVGQVVEVELAERPAGAPPFSRGELVRGTLLGEEPAGAGPGEGRVWVVRAEGRARRFCREPRAGTEPCRQVLPDFAQVGVRVLDDCTLQLELEYPTPYFLSLTGFYPLFPTPRHVVEAHGFPAWVDVSRIVGNGPFRLASRKIRDRMRLVRNEHYWGRDEVRLGSIDVLATESAATGLNLYLSGQVDWITTVPTTVVPELMSPPRSDFQPAPEMTVYYYRLNTTRPPLDQVAVRRALAMAVNRQELVEHVTRAGETPARSFVPPGMAGYTSPEGVGFAPAEARRLLAEAGFPDGRALPKLTILYNNDEGHQLIAEMIQDQWKRHLGVQVEPVNQEWGSYLNSQRQLQYQVSRSGWVADFADPNTFLKMYVTGGADNQTGWSNADYDRLIDQARRESDQASRLGLLHQAEAILLREQPIIPLYFRVSKNMVREGVRGFFNNPLDVHPLRDLWIERPER